MVGPLKVSLPKRKKLPRFNFFFKIFNTGNQGKRCQIILGTGRMFIILRVVCEEKFINCLRIVS